VPLAGAAMTVSDRPRRRLGELLVAARLARADAVEGAAARQRTSGLKIGEQLVRDGAVREADLAVVLAFQLGVPVVTLARERIDAAALALVPAAFARERRVLPLRMDGARLVVAMADPTDDGTLVALAQRVARSIVPLLALPAELERVIADQYAAPDAPASGADHYAVQGAPASGAVAIAAETPAVAGLVDFAFAEAFRQGASDVHFEPEEHGVRVRLRIDGSLRELTRLPRELAVPIVARLWAMAGEPSAHGGAAREALVRLQDRGRSVRARLSTVATVWGEATVVRLFERTLPLLNLGDLGMESGVHERYGELLGSPHGLIAVCGLVGAGTTTTLYASLRAVDRVQRNVVSIEDPVEQVLEGISQVPVDDAAGGAVATAWRAVLHQEPDVILLGELRTKGSIDAAAEVALGGRLVLSSVRAGDAVAGLSRLLSLGAAPRGLGASVTAVLAQQLVRTLCPQCKVERRPEVLEAALLRQAKLPAESVWSAAGCPACSGTGYRGRTGIFELLVPNEDLRAALAASASGARLRELTAAAGFVSLREAGLRLVVDGRTSVREVVSRLPVVG